MYKLKESFLQIILLISVIALIASCGKPIVNQPEPLEPQSKMEQDNAAPEPTDDQAQAAEVNPEVEVKNPIIDPQVDKIMHQMSNVLQQAKEFSFTADVVIENVLPTGQKLQFIGATNLSIRRPNKIYARYLGDYEDKQLWYDGKKLTLLAMEKNVFVQKPAPPDIDSTIDALVNRHGYVLPLGDLIYSNPYQALMDNTYYGFYVGFSYLRDIPCHHLAFVHRNVDWQIWIEDGQFIPRRLVITYKNSPSSPQYIANFSDWKFNAVRDSKFIAQLPANAVQIDFLDSTSLNQPSK